ncbi:unnamed protein product [Vitrella brassicaformis CCMP3155]|uniref:Uncharacterized protein n=1 Tax=Vitrella brassicaformis (strain CCMP3155) TaxID=1169540 RepID=A0A0G4ET45_VITBC|nr:unnamed protein product [Vitrella brassicaformis CCMP3155]|eukprot:CEM01003.1 unnamed protein product [Vitrella brassicaformis CCMP3155]
MSTGSRLAIWVRGIRFLDDDEAHESFMYEHEKAMEAAERRWPEQSGLMDTDWQRWHARLGPLRGCLWDPPGASGKRLARLLATEGRRWREEQLPSERILICACTILFRAPDVTGKDIAKTVERRMDQWEKRDFEQLVQEAERNNALLATRPVGKDDTNEATLRQFRRLIDKGKVKQGVRLLTERGGGGALDPNGLAEADPAGRTVREVLESKHSAQSDPDPSSFLDRPLPPLTQVEITTNHIDRAARATKGGAGPLGGGSSVWHLLPLKFGAASAELRRELAAMTSHIANEDVPWEQLQALRACRLIGQDKQPGVRPIEIGEVLMRIMGKAMAKAVGVDAEIVCGADQLCTGLKGGGPGGGEGHRGAITPTARRASWWCGRVAERAREVFGDTDVEIVSGARYMGGFVGTAEGKRAYTTERVQEWQRCVNRMAEAAAKYPQAAHTALTTSLQAEWDFFMRVMPEERATFEPLRDALTHYLTQLSSHAVTPTEARLMMRPARHGGMGVMDPTERVAAAYETSTKGTSLLVSTIQNGDPPDGPPFNPFQHRADMHQAVKEGRWATDEAAKERFEDGLQQLPPERRRAVHRAIEAKTAPG